MVEKIQKLTMSSTCQDHLWKVWDKDIIHTASNRYAFTDVSHCLHPAEKDLYVPESAANRIQRKKKSQRLHFPLFFWKLKGFGLLDGSSNYCTGRNDKTTCKKVRILGKATEQLDGRSELRCSAMKAQENIKKINKYQVRIIDQSSPSSKTELISHEGTIDATMPARSDHIGKTAVELNHVRKTTIRMSGVREAKKTAKTLDFDQRKKCIKEAKRQTTSPKTIEAMSGKYEKISPIIESRDPKVKKHDADMALSHTLYRSLRNERDGMSRSSHAITFNNAHKRKVEMSLNHSFDLPCPNFLSPRILVDEDSFYEGSFDEEFLSGDRENLERCRILEQRVSSRLQQAFEQNATGSIVSLEGINMCAMADEDDEKSMESDLQADGCKSMEKPSKSVAFQNNPKAQPRRRFDFESSKPIFVSTRKAKGINSIPEKEEKKEAQYEWRTLKIVKLFRRKSNGNVDVSKANVTKNVADSNTKKIKPAQPNRYDLPETRSEETSRYQRNLQDISEDRDQEPYEYEILDLLDEEPFVSCFYPSFQ